MTAYLDRFNGRWVTTEWVLMELADALPAPTARSTVVAFVQAVRAEAQFEVIAYDPAVYRAGFDLFGARPEKSWALTDCISFAAIAQRGLSEALTADRRFERARSDARSVTHFGVEKTNKTKGALMANHNPNPPASPNAHPDICDIMCRKLNAREPLTVSELMAEYKSAGGKEETLDTIEQKITEFGNMFEKWFTSLRQSLEAKKPRPNKSTHS